MKQWYLITQSYLYISMVVKLGMNEKLHRTESHGSNYLYMPQAQLIFVSNMGTC